jgi:anti-sigma factor RsiW
MNRCTAIRWKIPGFLNGNLPADMMEEVREHLDKCTSCGLALAHPARVDAVEISNGPRLREDFTERLLQRLPSSFTGQKLAAMVAAAFIASGVFGVAIWAGIKELLGGAKGIVDASTVAATAQNNGLYQSLLSASTLQYVGLGLVTVIICLVVIAVVDRPRDEAATLGNES